MSGTALNTLRPAIRSTAALSDRNQISFALLLVWLRRSREREALAALHSEQIREAGLDPVTLRAESLKAFWRG